MKLSDAKKFVDNLPTDMDLARHHAESMKLFERDGVIHMGVWRRWRKASTKQAADAVLAEFKAPSAPVLPS